MDPIQLLKQEIKTGNAYVYLLSGLFNKGADSYVITWRDQFFRVAWINKKYSQPRNMGRLTKVPSGDEVTYQEIPLPIRHSLAGWMHYVENYLER